MDALNVQAPRRRWVVALAALAGVLITLALGFWQLGRAHQKLALQAAIEQRRGLPPVAAAELGRPGAAEDLRWRSVTLRGRWDASHTVYLDNRQFEGRPGFYVVTPLLLEGSGIAVAVQRGWVPRNFLDRRALPQVATPAGPVELAGRIAPPPARLYQLGGEVPGPIRQNLDLAAWRAETGQPLLTDLSVQQEGPPGDGLARDWPAPALGVERHYGYLAQWWALSALIAFLYVWFQFIAPRRRNRRA